ncbi:hypothetical protein H0H87_008846 [Tephrocybe sp. NHM501043]|nr:hypothetical protein H0H87_008846 [Tephrocybe sp. NHM501043]
MGLMYIPDQYHKFMVMVQEYQHLKMLKQASCSHNLAGTAATKPGEYAVLCPTCPHEKLNLPEGWKDTPPQDQ